MSIIQIETRVVRVCVRSGVIVKEMAGDSEGVDRKQTYKKRKRKKKITWNRSKNNKVKSEVAFIQSLKEAYNSVRLVISEPNL
jgi:hypothetical protein